VLLLLLLLLLSEYAVVEKDAPKHPLQSDDGTRENERSFEVYVGD
jgi:hypothetical protein